ncbi:hypothetical protein [Moorena sp. SIO3H5]|nr:hypothetical protein [Moorena sp. SIO3H5]NEO69786.1 hypothetical protein [Moorena sp. SIO3H5]
MQSLIESEKLLHCRYLIAKCGKGGNYDIALRARHASNRQEAIVKKKAY